MTRTSLRAARMGFLALLTGVGSAAAQTKVYPWPGDPSWTPWTVADATAEITGANPVPPEDSGNIRRMATAWLAWGRAKGLR